jgi:hypothetical protein
MKRTFIRTTFKNICKALPEYSNLTVSIGDSNLLITGAKAYYRGGGWWAISGYSWDGKDVDDVIDILNR